MRRPVGSVRRASAAALAILLGVFVLMSLAVDGCAEQKPKPTPTPTPTPTPSLAAIGGRKVLPRRTLEDFKQDDPFQDSERRVPNGPDPIHNRGAGKSGRSPGRA